MKIDKEIKNDKEMRPVEAGKSYELEIVSMGYNGEGVARVDNFTVFVEGALLGEKVLVKIKNVKSKFAVGELQKVIAPSEDRVTPFCEVYEQCGGCQIAHMSYNAQLSYKKSQVEENLKRTAGLCIGKGENDITVEDVIGMENPFYYRNKASFPVGFEGNTSILGFYKNSSHQIIPLNNVAKGCLVQHEAMNKICKIISNYIDDNKITVYNEETHSGIIRHIVTKVGFQTGEIMVVIVTNGTFLPNKNKLVDSLLSEFTQIKSIVQNINDQKTNKILGEESQILWGQPYIEDYIGELKFRISPESFFQVNPVQTKKLYDIVKEYANLNGTETVIDAYCGIGTISLSLAQNAKTVFGIEIVEKAIEDAKINAQINNIINVGFIAGKSEEIMPQLIAKGSLDKVDVIIMDPPRKGCEREFLESCIKISPDKMIYVSCNPATLARDLAYICENGYKVEKVQPVDFFSHTRHVETVVLIEHE